ncbi:phosphomannomutase [Devosia sp.]|uniref:phosphomannomutase n=1 Tax=Devosia sp. TaxID=1871048 RepID=UPI0019E7274E|nr:phosphomannomutase [Devosia sp.]MBE0579783.1 phosphomannomutase [Devosia sp.]
MPGSSLKFGTSGLRGLASELEGQAARRYTSAFLKHLAALGQDGGGRVFVAGDFRPSSAAIAQDCAVAIDAAGLQPVDCGAIPTPALALHAMAAGCAAIMVTGSHIPADRNGLKFYLPSGEISKEDEAGIMAALADDAVADRAVTSQDEAAAAYERYFRRYAGLLPESRLTGWRIGVFEHSTVARDMLGQLLRHFGAETVSLGRIDGFVPVDTEAFGDAVLAPLGGWVREHGLDALVSADGDGDRPLLMDRHGDFVRGDVLGLITARYLGARSVVTPVTSNSGIERSGAFSRVVRTRVGSPYVVAAMADAPGAVIGFEANGGTLVGQGVSAGGVALPPLATRDAVLPLLCVLGLAAGKDMPIDALVRALPLQHALADRLQDVPSDKSARFIERLGSDAAYAADLFAPHGIAGLSQIDGMQFQTSSGDMVHFRASGNAPELRCYVEGSTPDVARELLAWGLEVAAREVS